MTDKSINLCDTEDEKQRYGFNMLPTYFITQMGFDFQNIIYEINMRKIYYKPNI